MKRNWNAWIAVRLFVPGVVLALSVGCGAAQPAQPAAATRPAEPTATRAEVATATRPATATQAPTATARPSDTPAAPAAATDAAGPSEEVAYELPVKGNEDAPVALIEFSDYL